VVNCSLLQKIYHNTMVYGTYITIVFMGFINHRSITGGPSYVDSPRLHRRFIRRHGTWGFAPPLEWLRRTFRSLFVPQNRLDLHESKSLGISDLEIMADQYITHDGSMVLLYMVTWIPSIYPIYVSIYTIHGSYGVHLCHYISLHIRT
jgi:hypothetical protein